MKFYLYRNSQTYGPYSEESIQEYLRSGRASQNDWAWRKREKEWARLSDLIETAKQQEQSYTETDDAQLLSLLNTPATSLVTVLSAPARGMVTVLKAKVDKG